MSQQQPGTGLAAISFAITRVIGRQNSEVGHAFYRCGRGTGASRIQPCGGVRPGGFRGGAARCGRGRLDGTDPGGGSRGRPGLAAGSRGGRAVAAMAGGALPDVRVIARRGLRACPFGLLTIRTRFPSGLRAASPLVAIGSAGVRPAGSQARRRPRIDGSRAGQDGAQWRRHSQRSDGRGRGARAQRHGPRQMRCPAAAEVTRLRLGLEGLQPFRLAEGATLTPSVEIGVRHDGGDAETGFGVDIGGGLAWSDTRRGITAEFRGPGLLTHEADGFRERGVSGSLFWDRSRRRSGARELRSPRHRADRRAAG